MLRTLTMGWIGTMHKRYRPWNHCENCISKVHVMENVSRFLCIDSDLKINYWTVKICYKTGNHFLVTCPNWQITYPKNIHDFRPFSKFKTHLIRAGPISLISSTFGNSLIGEMASKLGSVVNLSCLNWYKRINQFWSSNIFFFLILNSFLLKANLKKFGKYLSSIYLKTTPKISHYQNFPSVQKLQDIITTSIVPTRGMVNFFVPFLIERRNQPMMLVGVSWLVPWVVWIRRIRREQPTKERLPCVHWFTDKKGAVPLGSRS